MKNFTHIILLLVVLATSNSFTQAQSILNPADSVITYDSLHRPTEPAWGQIGKWVRTRRVSWNTDAYKSYIYKGVAFRIRFPKTYNPTANDGKKYPMLVFFHGLGEAAPITDNEFQLYWGGEMFSQAVENGTFDGYVIFLQSQGFWGGGHYDYVKEIIDYMVVNNKLDPFKVIDNGLSAGGQGTWEMYFKYPTYINAVMPMSSCAWYYGEPETVEKIKYTPIWNFNGGADGSPAPETCESVRANVAGAGGNYRNSVYANVGHDSWNSAWGEPDFWPFITKTYASNPWPLFGKTDFCSSDPINTRIGLTPGYDAYQWRKDGVVITGATANSIAVTQPGKYEARVLRGTMWSDWSRTPVVITSSSCSNPSPTGPAYRIEAENYLAMNGIQTENTQDVGGGKNVGWQDTKDWLDYNVMISAAGNYTVNFRVATADTGVQFQLRKADGSVLTTMTVPSIGAWQTYQTISTTIALPAGQQILRIYTSDSKKSGWNLNWWELKGAGITLQPPVANAGADQTINLPTNSITITGSGSDPDGTISSYQWTQVSGPSTATIASPTSAQTSFTALVQGTYVFRLTVKDNSGITATDDVSVVVNPVIPPATGTVRIEAENYSAMNGIQTENTGDVAGGGKNVGWQENNDWMDYVVNMATAKTYTLNFRVATPNTGVQFQLKKADGTVLTTVTIPNTGGWQTYQTISVSVALPAGQQTLRIFTSDAKGSGWNFNWWEIATATTPPPNQAPTVNAGTDQTITLPVNSVTLSGSAVDSDGSIASYQWSQVSGPSTATISAATSAATSVSALLQGTYTFRLTVKDNAGATTTDDVVVVVNAAVTPPVTGTIRIEAENYSAMSGIQTENTADAGGGKNVGWQENNDWMDYSVNIASAGTYAVNFRVATVNTGVQFQLRKADGTVLTTVTAPNTGWWQTFQTVSANVSLPAGNQTLRIFTTDAKGSGWNINWWEITTAVVTPPPPPPPAPITSTQRIEAESYTTMSGIKTENTWDVDGALNVGWQENNDWMDYSVNLAAAGTYKLNFRVATVNTGVQFQLKKADGTVITTVTVPNTGGWQTYQTVSTTVTLPAGQQTLRILTSDAKVTGWNFNWWEISSIIATTAMQAPRTAAEVLYNESSRMDAAPLEVYPNPVIDGMQLVVNNAYTGNVRVEVISMAGHTIKAFSLNKPATELRTSLRIGELQRGAYIVRVSMDGWNEVRRIVKQ